MSEEENGEEVNLSPQDLEKVKAAATALSQARNLLENIDEDVREEVGEVADALTRIEEAEDLLDGLLSDDGNEVETSNPA